MIQAIKDVIGERTFWIRLNATELMDDRGGNTEADCLEIMEIAEAAGADGISIVIGWHESTKGALGRDLPSEHWLYLAENAKKRLSIPIAFGPRFGDPALAEQAIKEGKIDFWEVCRPFLADPELLIKVREDRIEEIKPCVGGLMCLSRMFRNLPYVCSMNPVLGHEYEAEYKLIPTEHPKTVFVIGGGPSGMEAAITAARKGHEVTLFERSDRLGGQLKSASTEISGGHVFNQLILYYRTQLEKYNVKVRYNTRINRRLVSEHRPDVCIVATGARIEAPPLPGLSEDRILYADQFTEKDIIKGKKIFVLGGNRAALVVAERLCQEGNEVAILDQGEKIAADSIPTFKWRHMAWVRELKIELIRDTAAVAASPEGLHLKDRDGNESVRPFDLVVISGPRRANNPLTQDLIFSCDELYTVGDAISPRNLCDAVHEGYKIGVRI
jgi:2,4-dienoyl-CoA reductase (NADPH2)